MNEAELKRTLAMKTGLTLTEITNLLTELANVVGAILDCGENLTLPHIGKLVVKNRLARIGRNPKTGETIQIQPKRVVTFTAARWLSERVAL